MGEEQSGFRTFQGFWMVSIAISPDITGVQVLCFVKESRYSSGLNEIAMPKGMNRKPASKRIHVSQSNDY